MTRLITFAIVCFCLSVSPAFSQVNESKEFPNVFHSPASKSTPSWTRSVFQLEVVVKKNEESEAQIQYVNGTAVSRDGLVVSVLNEPGVNKAKSGGIQSATVLMLDGSSTMAELVSYEPAYGVAVFRVKGLELRPLELSKAPLVAKRRVNWHTIYKRGQKTILYTRPLSIHKSKHQMAETNDLCEVTCLGTSALSADRTGSALVAHDGTLVGIMGWHKHWNITPKNSPPRKKLAWAVTADVIQRLLKNIP